MVKNSEVFKGFTRQEIKEFLIEMPELRKMEKNANIIKPPKSNFKSQKLLALDNIAQIKS